MASPSERIVAEAGAPLTIVNAAGRKLEFRRPSALDRLRLFKALGPGLSAKGADGRGRLDRKSASQLLADFRNALVALIPRRREDADALAHAASLR